VPQSFIRPIAIAIIRKGDQILVGEHHDGLKDKLFYRPLGGGVEFGEYGRDTLIREMKEEVNAEINVLEYLGTIENIFVFEGIMGHEIVQVYAAEFVDPRMYEQPTMIGVEDNEATFNVVWKSLESFQKENAPPLYPVKLLDLINVEKTVEYPNDRFFD
jgi:ADP-ribose pyrophosphatase YjhB (NUDIX family)